VLSLRLGVSNRREFLRHAICLAALEACFKAIARESPTAANASDFTDKEQRTLIATIDEIIPRGEGMPSASQAGGAEYLKYLGWQYPEIREDISQNLKTVDKLSADRFERDFSTLGRDQRVQILRAMEKAEASAFSTLVGYVYEAYYSNPRVLGLICCTPSSAPAEEDERLLAPVRKRPHFYRQVP
jgi:Gluconate 2-dehydrogenase subunit 3